MPLKKERQFYLPQFKAISHAISTYEDLNLLIKHFAENISRAFKVKGCSILLFDEREKQLFMIASCGISEDYLNKGPIFFDDKQDAFKKGIPVYIDNMHTDPRVQYPKEAKKENLQSMLSIPIKCRDVVTGILRIYHHSSLQLHDDDINSLCILTEHLGLVIENNGLKNFMEGLKLAMANLPLRILKGL